MAITESAPRVAGAAGQVSGPSTQSLMLTFFGIYLLDQQLAVSAGSVIACLGRAGCSEEAIRSTLNRMAKRGLLARHRVGRRTYFALTPRARKVLADGRDRVWRTGAVNRDWDGTWTMVGFSLPEAWRSERHGLRSRLVWAGFGPLQNGLWVAPGRVDVMAAVADLGLERHLKVFHARAAAPTEAGDVLEQAFDVPGIAARYGDFLTRWDHGDPLPDESAGGGLAGQLLLQADWVELVRQDPHLPAEHLPRDWPAARAESVFRDLARRWEAAASAQVAELLDTSPVG